MLYSVKGLEGFAIQATDGEIGQVKDIFFDDEQWTIRYLVILTANWLAGRRVLISPASVRDLNLQARRVLVELTREQIKNSPDVDSDMPVSRLKEIEMAEHFRWPNYWAGPSLWGAGMYPYIARGMPVGPVAQPDTERQATVFNEVSNFVEQSHLRSVNEVIGYAIEARDGAIGDAQDFLIHRETWRIENLVIDTTKWLPGGEVRVPTDVIESVDWRERKVFVTLTREQIKQSTLYNRAAVTS